MIKLFQFKSIRANLTKWFILVAMLPLIVVITFVYNHMAQSKKVAIYNKLEAICDLKVEEVNNWLDERIGDLRIVTSDLEIRSLETIDDVNENDIKKMEIITIARDLLKRYVQHYDAFYEIFIISPHTKWVIISTNEKDEGRDRSEDPYFTGALETKGILIKDIHYSKTKNRPSMAFSIPIYGLKESNHIFGILVARIDLEASLYRMLLHRTGMGKTGETLIVNKDVIALNELRWYENAPLKLKIKAKPAIEASRGNTGIITTKDYRGKKVLAAYTHIPRTGWGFVAKQDLQEIYTPIHQLRNWTFIIGFITFFGVIILAFHVSKSISEPIKSLFEGSEIIGGGNLDHTVGTDAKDEVGELSRRFDQMIENLKTVTASRDELNKEIIERKKVEEELKDAAIYIDAMGDALIVLNMQRNVIKLNQAAEELLGYTQEEMAGLTFEKIFPEKEHKKHYAEMETAIKSGMVTHIETYVITKDEREIPVLLSGTVMKNPRGEPVGFVSVCRDITDIMRAEELLKHKAFYDQLTDLPNRSLFTKHLERVVAKRLKRRKDYQFAVLFMDLDRFKIVNDSLGHIIGDQLLIGVARRLEACARSTDVISRFGGDEFAILLDDISDVSDAAFTAERIQEQLTLPFNLGGHQVFTTASIGIALSATGYKKAVDVLRDADSAMYRAKTLGRARYEIFDTEMHESAMNLFKLEADLRRAIEHKEFLAHYQPIVSHKDKRIISAEALIRWQRPEQGLVPPMEFIPLAEDTGLILKIGEWILRTACTQNKIWQDAGYHHLQIGVNFSAYQFKHQNIPELIKKILHETGMTAESLIVEVTESIAMEEQSIEILNKLSAMGVKSLDR